jgi:ankyrin repeat protein
LEAYPEATRVTEKVKSTQNINIVETNLPLHIALRQMSSSGFELVQALLNAFPASTKTAVYQHIEEGIASITALHMVSRLAHSYESEIVRALVRALLKANPNGAALRDAKNRVPLHFLFSIHTQENLPERNYTSHIHGIMEDLLDSDPEITKVLDDEDQLPLHHACHSGDEVAVAAMLKHFPEGASQSTKNGKLPLHLVFEGVVAENGNDAILQALLQAYPEAAATSTQRGDYPLHLAASSSNHLRYSNDTLEALIDAYPAALKTTNNNKALPLHLSLRMLFDRSGNAKSSHLVRTLLSHYPEAARVQRFESYPLQDALGFAARSPLVGQEPDIALEIVQLLYDAYPNAALASDLQGETPLHITMHIIGRMGGHNTSHNWAALTSNIISTYPDTLSARTKPVEDNEGDTPFHTLCDVLAQSVAIYERDRVLETLVYNILSTYPGAIEDTDDYGLYPLEIIESEISTNNASKVTIIPFLKTWLKRGVSYWELEGELERIRKELLQAKDLNVCEKLQSEIDALKSTIKYALEDSGSTSHDESDEAPSNTQQNCELDVEDSDSNQDACGICNQQVGMTRLLSKQIEHLASVLDSQITS